MEPAQLPPLDSNDQIAPEQPTLDAQPSFLRRYRWVLTAGAFVVAIGVITTLLALNHGASNNNASSLAPASSASKGASQTTQATNTNTWKGTIDPATIPLGDGHVSSTQQVGYIDSCTTNFRGGGARHSGSWINSSNNTWSSETKVAVEGSVNWPSADYVEATSSGNRVLTTNDLPEVYPTGIFPISQSDPAYQYDTNPNHIGTQSLSYSLPLNPVAAASPGCLPLGPIGILDDGVVLFDALDDAGRDAVAHETQDLCNGHPNGQEMYHYHNVPSCIRDKATVSSTLVGYAFDGYGIYIERDSKGNLPSNADLDACHGRTSQVMWNGKLTDMYHYDATLEYPYTLGCFHASDAVSQLHGW